MIVDKHFGNLSEENENDGDVLGAKLREYLEDEFNLYPGLIEQINKFAQDNLDDVIVADFIKLTIKLSIKRWGRDRAKLRKAIFNRTFIPEYFVLKNKDLGYQEVDRKSYEQPITVNRVGIAVNAPINPSPFRLPEESKYKPQSIFEITPAADQKPILEANRRKVYFINEKAPAPEPTIVKEKPVEIPSQQLIPLPGEIPFKTKEVLQQAYDRKVADQFNPYPKCFSCYLQEIVEGWVNSKQMIAFLYQENLYMRVRK